MELFNGSPAFLELISCPAYSVKNGLVENANSAAQHLLITPGTPADALVETGMEDYNSMTENSCLSLTIQAGGKRFCAFVSRRAEEDLFLLDQEEDDQIHTSLFLASCALRNPLDRILGNIQNLRRMAEKLDPEILPYLNEITKGSYQIHRLVANMSDTIPYAQEELRCQVADIVGFLRETVEKAAALLEQNSMQLTFSCEWEEMFVVFNQEKLERAVHNLILNAATYPTGQEQHWITVELKRVNNSLHIIVSDNGRGISDEIFSSLFYRYRRKPTLENCRYGIGLGLPLVRAVAAAHGGTVLLERLSPTGTRATMTMQILVPTEQLLRAPRFRMDYAGEFDHALVELSDVIPAKNYEMI